MHASRDSISDIWGPRSPHGPVAEWAAKADERTEDEPESWVQAGCAPCSNGCDIGVKDGRIVGIRGRAADAVNKGRLGPKGLNGWQANDFGPGSFSCGQHRPRTTNTR